MKVKCTQCNKVSLKKEWIVSHEECELCTSHTFYTCPKCGDSDEYLFESATKEYQILNRHSTTVISSFRSLKKAKEELKKIALNSEKEGFVVNRVSDKQYTISGSLIYIKSK